ncbi:MAG: glycosyltransferase family 39 protein [Acidimicrobiales bacterium]
MTASARGRVPAPRPSDERFIGATLVGLTVVGVVIRVFVAGQDLFADELATYWIATTHGLRGVVETVSTTAEISPPLSFALSWLFTRPGYSSELLRAPALLAGTATIPLVYLVGARTVGRAAALTAAALTAFSPFMIYYSAEARGYGLLMALVLGSTYALLRAVDEGGRWWAVHGLAVCLAAYTHYTAVFDLGVQFLWMFGRHRPIRRSLFVATAAAAVAYAPWLPSLKGDIDSPTTKILNSISPFDWASVKQSLTHWTVAYPFALPWTRPADLPGTPALVLLAAGGALGVVGLVTRRARLGGLVGSRDRGFVLVVLLALATPVGAALQSAAGNNVFNTRSLAASLPYLALAVGAFVTHGRARCGSRRRC